MLSGPKPIVLSTAGAIPVKNEKGQVTMEKVKVARYVTGKRPGYAPRLSDEEEEEEDAFPLKQRGQDLEAGNENEEGEEDTMAQKMIEDQKIRQIIESRNRMQSDGEEEGKDSEEARIAKHRRVVDAMDGRDDDDDRRRPDGAVMSDDEAELSDEEIARRREMLKRRALSMKIDKELLEDGEGGAMEEKEEAEEESEYEECTDSESDEENLRLKPVFVRKEDRITIHERERALQKEKDQEYEQKRITHERRQETLKMLEVEIRGELEAKSQGKKDIDELDTEDENEEEAYEAWRVRELKRLKLDKEERERYEKEKQEVERLHNMTEEGRKRELKLNPKVVTNKAAKGKYKFLQKYYHRGVFYLDKEDSIFKRDYTAPTLEDRFNKTVLPKVMQVKNFGRSRRTKYTHLDDQDTTQFNSPWMSDTATNLKFHTTKGGGMKQNINAQRPKRY